MISITEAIINGVRIRKGDRIFIETKGYKKYIGYVDTIGSRQLIVNDIAGRFVIPFDDDLITTLENLH